MDGVIPPSPYPVMSSGPPPSRIIKGPYIASRPAYEMFRDQKPGPSIGDMIAADMRSQAKAEGRPDPVVELPENRRFWIKDDVLEPLPEWPNPANNPAPAPAPVVPAVGAPAPAAAEPILPPVPAAPQPVPAAPASALPVEPASRAADAPVWSRTRVAARVPTTTRAAQPKLPHVARQMARTSYPRPARPVQRPTAASPRPSVPNVV